MGLQISRCMGDKYRYAVLGGDVGLRCRELLRDIARSQKMIIYAGSVNRDHVHMLIGIPPSFRYRSRAMPEGQELAQAAIGV